MAAPMIMSNFIKISQKLLTPPTYSRYTNQSVRSISFWRKRSEKKDEQKEEIKMEHEPVISETESHALSDLKRLDMKMQTCVRTVKAYKPPEDVEDRIKQTVNQVCGDIEDWKAYELGNRRIKFRLLTKLMSDLDHNIPNSQLNKISTVQDVVEFYKIEVRDTNSLEDLAELDLPKNLHIQLYHLRFREDKDTMFGGVSAFGNHKKPVTSLKRNHRSNFRDGKRIH